MSRYYNGPLSDHFDGERFFDREAASPRSRRELLRWYLQRRLRVIERRLSLQLRRMRLLQAQLA